MQSNTLTPEGGSFIQRDEGSRYLHGLALSHGIDYVPGPDDLRDSRMSATLTEPEPEPDHG